MKESRVLAAIYGTEWAITSEALQGILTIAKRENEEPSAVEARLGRPLENTHKVEIRDGVAVIPVVGPLFRRANIFTRVSGATSYSMLAQDLSEAVANPVVKAIVLNVDSPGGSANGVAELASHIYDARASGKEVVAYVGGMAASAAYWLASAASRIVGGKTSLVGSIGVVLSVGKGDGDAEEIVSSQSPYKRADPSTEDGRARLQAMVDSLASIFIEDVAKYRGSTVEHVSANFGQGDVLLGRAAQNAGMIDSLGTFEGLISELNSKQSIRPSTTYEVRTMNLENLRAEHPGLVKQIQAEARAEAERESAEIAAAAKADADKARAEGATTERARVLGIIRHAEATGREALAGELADMPDMTVEKAAKLLAATPKGEPKAGSEFEAAMRKTNPEIEADASAGGEDAEIAAAAARIAAIANEPRQRA